MAESRVFQKVDGVTIEGIGRCVQNFLRSSKGLMVQGGKAGEGYIVQAKENDSWKKVAGMSNAIEVQISDAGNGILVNIGNGQWSDKVGAGVLGWFVFAPLAVTAVVGTVQQKKLPGEIFAQIERYVASGGKDMYIGTDFVNAAAGNIICPHCKSEVPEGQAFCSKCGKPLTEECPGCGESVAIGLDFCPKCGSNMKADNNTVACIHCGEQIPVGSVFCIKCGKKQEAEQAVPESGMVCAKCGKINAEGNAFCSGCGEKLEALPELPQKGVCPKCGKVNAVDDLFCAECGERLDVLQSDENSEPEKLVCPDCGAETDPQSKFCTKCGHKF